MKTEALNFDVARFTARRIVRILPPYWIAIVTLMASIVVMRALQIHPAAMADSLNVVKILEQTLLFNLRPEWLNGSFWTLPIEVHWYFICPILLWLWTRSRRAFFTIAVLCAYAAITTRFQAPDVKFLPAFMLGIVAAEVCITGHPLTKYAPLAFVVLTIAGCFERMQLSPLSYPCWELAMFSLVISAGHIPPLGRIFSWRAFAPIAWASYSIYLVHAPVLGTIEKNLPASFPVNAGLIVGGLCGVAAGLLFSLFAERPFRRGVIRAWMLTALDRSLPNAFRRLGIDPFIGLGSPASAPVAFATPTAAGAEALNLSLVRVD